MASYVTLEQAKEHLRVDFDDDDTYIDTLCDVAETAILNEIKAFVPGTGTVTTAGTTALTGDDTTFTDYRAGDIIKVVGETNRTIATVTDDENLTVSAAFSTSETDLAFKVQSSPLESGALPKPLYQAMLLLLGQLYENREPVNVGNLVTKLPYTLDYLIAPYKDWVIR
jgi:hypothetical protein